MAEITTTAGVTAVVIIILTTLLLVIATKLFSSSRSRDNNGGAVAPNIQDASSSSPSSSSSSSTSGPRKYDVFLSFRGEDTRNTFVGHLYSALDQHGIRTYKDDVTLDRGDTIGPALLSAIRESRIALIIFSENYADSSWCLDELSHIMEDSGQIVIPIFYNVDPSNVRKQTGQFGKSFAKLSKNKKNKVESWKKALVAASNLAGLELKQVANGHEPTFIQEIVGDIFKKLSSFNSAVDDEGLVGMGSRLQELRSHLRIGSGGVRMVGIWGVGGGGKTTLATSLYKELKISGEFHGCCFVENIREESRQQNGLKSLQEKILSTIFDKEMKVESVELGKDKIKQMLCGRRVLIVLDDVDHLKQLEALAGRHNWFGNGSRIIITTRDEHVLKSHRVDEVCPVSLLSDDEAIQLFKIHAYQERNPVEDYGKLSLRVITYANRLPLALKILGAFLYGKDKDEWTSALDKLKDIPNSEVTGQLKISYDGLDRQEKELFLDIACFHRGTREDEAMVMLDACGFHPGIGIKVLKQKALIVSKDGKFDMHDLVQEMAHYIVRGEHPCNPEKHSRLWRYEDIQDICSSNATMENDKIEAIQLPEVRDVPSNFIMLFIMLVSNMKKLRFLQVYLEVTTEEEGPSFLSNDLRYIDWSGYPGSSFPECFQPKKLLVLKMVRSLQKELWKGYKYLQSLKELELRCRKLVMTPDFGGLPCLEKLRLDGCHSLEEIHQSLGNHSSLVSVEVMYCHKLTRFPAIVKMDKLESLYLSNCGVPMIEAKMDNLVEYLPSLQDLKLIFMEALVRTPDFGGLPCLQRLFIHTCVNLEEIHQSLGNHSSLVEVRVYNSHKLTRFPTIVKMDKLKILDIFSCEALIEFPKIEANLDSLVTLSLENVGIDFLPSTIGEYCTNLISLSLKDCSKLRSMDGTFHALKGLQNFELKGCKQFEKLPKDLFNENLDGLSLKLDSSSIKQLIPSSVQRLLRMLRKLDLGRCGLKDGDIPNEIGELCYLRELDLHGNYFTRLYFSLSRLTSLKLLELSYCENLVELPELPSSLAILKAARCESLEVIKDNAHRRCKWLRDVSIWGKNITGGEGLLQSMLQGKAVKSGCMILRLTELEILRGFDPLLFRGDRCRMQLPENWYNDFSGFLFCATSTKYITPSISMKHVEKSVGGSWMGDSQDDDVFWEEEETVGDVNYTWVTYLPFSLLRDTSWWEPTSTTIEVELHNSFSEKIRKRGLKLVPKGAAAAECSSETTLTHSSSDDDDDDDDYKCKLYILHDSKSAFNFRLYDFDTRLIIRTRERAGLMM